MRRRRCGCACSSASSASSPPRQPGAAASRAWPAQEAREGSISADGAGCAVGDVEDHGVRRRPEAAVQRIVVHSVPIVKRGPEPGESRYGMELKIVNSLLIPTLEDEIGQLQALGSPRGDETKFAGFRRPFIPLSSQPTTLLQRTIALKRDRVGCRAADGLRLWKPTEASVNPSARRLVEPGQEARRSLICVF